MNKENITQNIERKSYSQDWHNYNLAQYNQKILFMRMLRELTSTVPENPQTKMRGRPFLDKPEMLFCVGLMLYCGKSSRISISDFKIAEKLGLISHTPNFTTVLNYLNRKDIEYDLKDLITISSLPLKQFDDGIITIDASGFSTSVFERWLDYKWGKEKKCKKRIWKKASVVSGVRTNIITSVEITEGYKHDSLMFDDLVEHTANKVKNIREISADMGYSSRAILEKCSSLGIVPYIPFKKNTSGKAGGSYIWSKMYKYFKEHQGEFYSHYHLRSNAESVFSMLKRNFSHRLRTKKEQAQNNEILAICLCHNLCCIIKALFEFGGFEIDFNKSANEYFAD